MGTQHNIPPSFQKIARNDGIFLEKIHDTCQLQTKLKEPTVCPSCSAVFHEERCQWLEASANSHQHNCPACQRIHDHFPAGLVTLTGDFTYSHHEEIMNLIDNLEKEEQAEHPLGRVMAIEKTGDGILITTTDIHLVRGIGETVHNAYQGDLEYHYNPGEMLLRVYWVR